MDKEEVKYIEDNNNSEIDYNDYYDAIENWIRSIETQERLDSDDLIRDDDDNMFYDVIEEWAKEIKINNKKGN